jgi:hypothetical protein
VALPSSRSYSINTAVCDLPEPCITTRQDDWSENVPGFAREAQFFQTRNRQLKGDELIRQTVLRVFGHSFPQDFSLLHALSPRQWRRLLQWLDYSGLALYFLDRLVELQQTSMLPVEVLAGLRRRLDENTVRTRSMTAESIAIQREFQRAGLWYALLKGSSLWPSSVPKPELRSQFDLDFLVAEEDIPEAREILAHRDYRLYDTNGRSWEFKRNEKPGIGLKDIYKDTGSWRVELHAEPTGSSGASQLDRREWRILSGFTTPVLSPVDLFLRQGLHAYKHICSQFARSAFLVEFRRHVQFYAEDETFWHKVHSAAEHNRHACVALGVTTQLISQVTGEFAPESLTSWTVRCLPRSAQLWIELYGRRIALASFPGNKLYLLLQMEPQTANTPLDRPLWQFLFPLRLPPPAIQEAPHEHISVRFARYRMRAAHLLRRLPFCFVEGVRFAWESRRWRRLLAKVPG